MKQKATVEGKSLIFNILFVLLNLTGLIFLVMAWHKNFEGSIVLFNVIAWTLILVSSILIFVFSGRMLMANVSRALVGGLFIVSGLVKANDPIGFSYKLEEYFEDGALAYRIKEWFGAPGFSLEFLINHALLLSIIICVLEIVLGVLVIIGGKIKLVSYLLIGMMLFFTFLTWHTANCDGKTKFIDRDTYAANSQIGLLKLEESKTNKEIKIVAKSNSKIVVDEKKSPQCVSDCGCFGDAMKGSVGRSLTPSESLWKDIVLVYLVFWIFIAQWIIEPNTRRQNVQFLIATLFVIAFFSWVFSWFFPLFFGLTAITIALWIRATQKPILGNYFGSALMVTLLTLVFVSYVLLFEPLKDYRPYAEGSNLIEKMNDGQEGKYENLLVYKNKKTGKTRSYDGTSKSYINSKIWEKPNWKYLRMEQKEVVPTRIPSITDQFNPFLSISNIGSIEAGFQPVKEILNQSKINGYRILDRKTKTSFKISEREYDGGQYDSLNYKVLEKIQMINPEITEVSLRDYIVETKEVLILSVKNLNKANWKAIEKYKTIFYECKKRNIPFLMITSANHSQILAFRDKYHFNIPIFLNDETELKAIARSNPSLLVIQKGIVKGKYPFRTTPTFDWLNKKVLIKK